MRGKKMNLDRREMLGVGYEPAGAGRAGSFMQRDDVVDFTGVNQEGVEILSMEDALKKHPEIRKRYYGRAFGEIGKEYEKDTRGGYFIRVKKGVRTIFPVQACLYLKSKKFRQKVHNLIILEEGAEAHLLTGCVSEEAAGEAYHLGISEFFVHRNASVNFTMIHSWKKGVEVEPKSVAIVEKGGSFLSNYVCLRPVRSIRMYPTCILKGRGGRARFNSVIMGYDGSRQDIGSRVVMREKDCSAEIVSRAVSLGGIVIARGQLIAQSPQVKAHLECRGLVISEKGTIHAIPELETVYRDVEMSHEAAIGKIRRDEIEYLASRGISEEEAQSVIIRGFMDVEILGLPSFLREEIEKVTERTLKETF